MAEQTKTGYNPNKKQKEALGLFRTLAKEFLLVGGSRSGKTFITVFVIILYALRCAGSRHIIARYRFNHVKNSIWLDTLPKVLSICFPDVEVHWNQTDHFIEFGNGSQIWIAGLDDKARIEKILGMEFLTVYLNEASQIAYAAYTMMKTRLAQKIMIPKGKDENGDDILVEAKRRMFIDANPPSKKHWMYQVFYENVEPIGKTALKAENYAHIQMNPADNMENIGSDYLEILMSMPEKERKRFMDGEFSDDSLDALWTSLIIGATRVKPGNCPPLKRIVVSIDPAVTSTDTSDDTGIIVGGIGYNDELYVLEDATDKYKPEEWAAMALMLFDKYEADMIIGEVNNGGDLIESVIRAQRPLVPYDTVRATRDKKTRAEPVAAVYALKKAHHVGELPDLELEMTTWAGKKGEKSPNRIDALVWLAAYLMPLMCAVKRKPPRITEC